MRYISTRGQTPAMSFTEAVAVGLAPDGGLLIPETLPDLRPFLAEWETLPYAELCTRFLRLFATDMDPALVADLVARSYVGFDHADVAPLVQLDEGLHVLELFHGPTLAFKDFALQLLGNLYEHQIERSGRAIRVLGATSGDTGAAAIHGLLGKHGVEIFMLYPDGGVSPLQERQMTCTGADNVFPIAIRGSFDDAQAAIKTIFGDLEFRRHHNLSAVNSINLARILAQCVYYLHAWFRLPREARARTEFVVPTGNFGNVLAGWLVRRMGVPMHGFRVATNQNDILFRLFETGVYAVGPVRPSVAPSMDIQVASNFERFLYYHENGDCASVRAILANFATTGRHEFARFDHDSFTASRADDSDIAEIIAEVYRRFGYVADPHTACGFVDPLQNNGPYVVLATAHPAKFPDVIRRAIGVESMHPTLEALKSKTPRRSCLAADAAAIRDFIAAHSSPAS